MTTPSIDGTPVHVGFGGGQSSVVLAPTTTTANLLVVGVFAEMYRPSGMGPGALNPVASVVGAGVTFAQCAAVSNTLGDGLNLELWIGLLLGPLAAAPITVQMTTAVDSGIGFAFGVNDVDILDPLDVGGGTLPASALTALGSSAPTIAAYHTTRATDLLLYLFGTEGLPTSAPAAAPAGWTEIFYGGNASGSGAVSLNGSTYAPGAILPGSSFVGPLAGYYGVMILLAFQASLTALTVPNVVGDTATVGVLALEGVGLVVNPTTGITFATSLTAPTGFIISQTPAAGSTSYIGYQATILVSEGLPPLWSLSPDWQTPVREKLGFLTDVLKAWTGYEQRRMLRIAPRRVFSFSTLATLAEKRYIENTLFAWSALVWLVPIFPDGQRLTSGVSISDTTIACDTVNRDFVNGGLAVALRDAMTAEIFQVATVASNLLTLSAPAVMAWSAGTRLYPLRSARLLSYQKILHESQQMFSLALDFTINEPCDWPSASGLAAYRTLPVLEDSPDVSTAAAADCMREAHIIDSSTGAIDVYDTALLSFPGSVHQWFLTGRTARANFRALIYLLKGRAGMIWVPSYNADLMLLESLGSAAVAMTVEAAGLTRFAAVQNRRDIRIELFSGAIYYRRIVSASIGSPGQEIVTLDSALGVAITAAQIRRISFMVLSRLDADEIEIQHLSMADGLATAQTPFRALNYEPV